MNLRGHLCTLRAFRVDDRDRVAGIANDRRISRNLTDRFPFPYTVEDAKAWVGFASSQNPVLNFAIEVDGEVAGGIGIEPHDGEKRHMAEVGYWLAPDYWGRGIATEALGLCLGHLRRTLPYVTRIQASVYAWNPASARVLEKCGFKHEATLSRAVVKDGQVTDEQIYALFTAD